MMVGNSLYALVDPEPEDPPTQLALEVYKTLPIAAAAQSLYKGRT